MSDPSDPQSWVERAEAMESAAVREKVHSILVKAELVRPGPTPRSTTSKLSSERAAELAELFAKGGTLSDIIHDER